MYVELSRMRPDPDGSLAPPPSRRRGVVLIVVLAALGLLALVGVSFTIFTGQVQDASRAFSEAASVPPFEEIIDFGMEQLLVDTDNQRSAIRGHSLVRDMYGEDAANNGFLGQRLDGQGLFIQEVSDPTPVPGIDPNRQFFVILTNIPRTIDYDPFEFGGWFMVVGPQDVTGSVPNFGRELVNPRQSFEVILHDKTAGTYNLTSNNADDFHKLIVEDTLIIEAVDRRLDVDLVDHLAGGGVAPSFQAVSTPLTDYGLGVPFVLDSRFRNSFNGPGMDAMDYRIGALQNTSARYANFRWSPEVVATGGIPSLDEDYDACDLENWFLALQSADGNVVIPSFHRPGILTEPDWLAGLESFQTPTDYEFTRAKFMRPRAADGHDATAFPPLLPDATGRVDYDVDNDGDGITDAVWVDLGYPVSTDPSGRLYKPLFAFTVIGLNGRFPLNTAGNMQARDYDSTGIPGAPQYNGSFEYYHTSHLGHSSNEVNPTYAFRNDVQAFSAGLLPDYDSLRDASNAEMAKLLRGDVLPDPTNGEPVAIEGRWGEPGPLLLAFQEQANLPAGAFESFTPRAGVTLDQILVNRFLNGVTSAISNDPADDDFAATEFPQGLTNSREFFEIRDGSGALLFPIERHRYYNWPIDPTGIGRKVARRTQPGNLLDDGNGFDGFGRVDHFFYERPVGLPQGFTPLNSVGNPGHLRWPLIDPWRTGIVVGNLPPQTLPIGDFIARSINKFHGLGAVLFPQQSGSLREVIPPPMSAPDFNVVPFTPFAARPFDFDNVVIGGSLDGRDVVPTLDYSEASMTYGYDRTGYAGIGDVTTNPRVANNFPFGAPSLNAAHEMNLYEDLGLDAPFGPADLEFLLRFSDIDGPELQSRLRDLGANTFVNGTINAPAFDQAAARKMRKLFSHETWDLNTYALAPDNVVDPTSPALAAKFGTNSHNAPGDYDGARLNKNYAERYNAPYAIPPLLHGGQRLNLNFPLPPSFDPDDPIRNLWVRNAINALRLAVPPESIDHPEEFAQFCQFMINIVDFRDPDDVMTRFVNPYLRHVPAIRYDQGGITYVRPPSVIFSDTFYTAAFAGSNQVDAGTVLFAAQLAQIENETGVTLTLADTEPLVQYGMEYQPVAINEVLSFAFPTETAAEGQRTRPRLYIELANMLTQGDDEASDQLDLANWDLVILPDDPLAQRADYDQNSGFNPIAFGRPDPITGQLPRGFDAIGGPGAAFDMNQLRTNSPGGMFFFQTPIGGDRSNPSLGLSDPIDGLDPDYENNVNANLDDNLVVLTTAYGSGSDQDIVTELELEIMPGMEPDDNDFDQFDQNDLSDLTDNGYQFILPNDFFPETQPDINNMYDPAFSQTPSNPQPTAPYGSRYYWLYLRRPINPNDPNSEMVVVDSMRFPFIINDAEVTRSTNRVNNPNNPPEYDIVTSGGTRNIYSVQRMQPYRGGQAVPLAIAPLPPNPSNLDQLVEYQLDTRYGYEEQIDATELVDDDDVYLLNYSEPIPFPVTNPDPNTDLPITRNRFRAGSPTFVRKRTDDTEVYDGGIDEAGTNGNFNADATSTAPGFRPEGDSDVRHTLGRYGRNGERDRRWAPFVFFDRDFMSVIELLYVPVTPPGLFTKQFVCNPTPLRTPLLAYLDDVDGNGDGQDDLYGDLLDDSFDDPNLLVLDPLNPVTTDPSNPLPSMDRNQRLTDLDELRFPYRRPPNLRPDGLNDGITLLDNDMRLPYTDGIDRRPVAPTFPYMAVNKMLHMPFYDDLPTVFNGTGVAVNGGPSSTGWYRILELLEVPSPANGAIGPVADGVNFDWFRQRRRPGQININLIIDEEVFYGVLDDELRLNRIPVVPDNAGAPNPTVIPPRVVTLLNANGYPVLDPNANKIGYYSMANNLTGFLKNNPIAGVGVYGGMSQAFSDFLKLRHGGSGFMFGFGTQTPQASTALLLGDPAWNAQLGLPRERPFRSLSYPDINDTILRPALLPPPVADTTLPDPYFNDLGIFNLVSSGGEIDGRGAAIAAFDRGRVNPVWGVAVSGQPPSSPPRRLLQLPDSARGLAFDAANNQQVVEVSPSAVSEDFNVNGPLIPHLNTIGTIVTTEPGAAVGGSDVRAVPDLAARPDDPSPGSLVNELIEFDPAVTGAQQATARLGGQSGGLLSDGVDRRRHPYYRYDWLQKLENLTTVRTMQFAVWVTVGFFEVVQPANPNSTSLYRVVDPITGAIGPNEDILGPELGLADGSNRRYRSFFIVDRSLAPGFGNPTQPINFRDLIVYSRRIE